MPEIQTPQWPDLYESYFTRLTDSQIATWNYELREGPNKIRNFTLEMLCAAIRRLSKRKERDGRTMRATLDDVRSQIFEIMYESRQSQVDPVVECEVCLSTGFICGVFFIHDPKTKSIIIGACANRKCPMLCPHAEELKVCYDLAVPCKCTLGQARLKAGKYENHDAIRRLQDMAFEAIGNRIA